MQRGLVEFAVLDKGLRSPNPGKQCEAILQFVPLLQRGSQVRRCLRALERHTREAGWAGDWVGVGVRCGLGSVSSACGYTSDYPSILRTTAQ
jgi:hypothetical protein